MPVFTFPLAFLGLLAVPLLLAIYWLRNRAKERRVSSLLLWLDEKQRWDGGRQIHRLQTPLLFFLEMLAILLLVTAAAKPLVKTGELARPLVVVLDDSFSMLAGADDDSRSIRKRAAQAIENEIRSNHYEPLRFVLAGETPQLLGEATESAQQAIQQLQNWKCGSPSAKLDEAIALAFEIGGGRSRVLAVTDHAPKQQISDSRLQWWSFGSPEPNLAFINATRTAHDGEERVMLEIANLSSTSAKTGLTIESLGAANSPSPVTNPQTLAFGPKESRRITLTLKNGSAPLRAKLSTDALAIDNEVILMPEAARIVRVDLRLRDAVLRELIEKAVESSRQSRLTSENPELIIGDESLANASDAEAWTLQLVREQGASSYLGPFVIDKAHPLTEGLSLGGVVWGAGSSQIPGMPIITAGNIALLTDVERAGRHELRLRLTPNLSTLQETPNWPILIWNLISWRAGAAPGLRQSNLRLGGEANLTVESGTQTVSLVDPSSKSRKLAVNGKTVAIKTDRAGIYEVRANQNKYAFAVNAISREESDLTSTASGQWGNWATAPSLQWEYRSITWLLLLFGLLAIAIHGWLVARSSGK